MLGGAKRGRSTTLRPSLTKLTLLEGIRRSVLPQVGRELAKWKRHADSIPNPELRDQALASLRWKRFHCEGGSVYAASAPDHLRPLVGLIVALQTISDYLDNLCDRSVSFSGDDFRALHQAMLDAVSPGNARHDYYSLHPNKDDGGYLESLVGECRRHIGLLPAYPAVEPHVRTLVGLYNDLQVHKHVRPESREERLRDWFASYRARFPELAWWEFAAAAGSTLGVFALFAAACQRGLDRDRVSALKEAYFPWVCGLHILLDYLIDQAEDRDGGDLNFVSFYEDPTATRQRLKFFYRRARERVRALPDSPFHETVLSGLLGLYLSDVKIKRQGLQPLAWDLLRAGGTASMALFAVCLVNRAVRGQSRGQVTTQPGRKRQA